MVEAMATLPFILLGEGVLAYLLWRVAGGDKVRPVVSIPGNGAAHVAAIAAVVTAWLFATVLTLWSGYLVAFVALHVLLFWLGAAAAWVGVVVFGSLLLATPVAWGWLAIRTVRVRY